MRFRYSLQAVLDLAVAKEAAAGRALIETRVGRDRARSVLNNVAEDERQLRGRFALRPGHAAPAVRLSIWARALDALTARKRRHVAALAVAEDRFRQAGATYETLVRRRRAIEGHRGVRYGAWRSREALRDATELDEANALAQARAASALKDAS